MSESPSTQVVPLESPSEESIDSTILEILSQIPKATTTEKVALTKRIGDYLRKEENRSIIMDNGSDILLKLFIGESDLSLLVQAVRCIGNLSFDSPHNIDKFMEHPEIIPCLIKYIEQSNNSELKRNAIACLANFAHESDAVRTQLNDASVLSILIPYLTATDCQEFPNFSNSLRAIENLCNCETCAVTFHKIGGLDILSKIVTLHDNDDILSQLIRTITVFFSFEILGDLTTFIDPLAVFLDANTETNLLNTVIEAFQIFGLAKDDQLIHLFSNGTIKKIIQLTKEEDAIVFPFLIKIAEKDKFQKNLVEQGILEFCQNIAVNAQDEKRRQHATKIIALVTLDDENMNLMIKETLPTLAKTLKDSDSQVVRFSAIAIGNLARTDSNCEVIIHNNFHTLLIGLLSHSELEVKGNASFALTNLIKLKSTKHVLVEAGILQALHGLLTIRADLLEFYLCDGIANICVGNEKYSETMIHLGVDKFTTIVTENDKPKCQYAAIKVLVTLAEAGSECKTKVMTFVDKTVLEAIEKLSKEGKDPKVVEMALKGLAVLH
jgi:hypothetical protein